MKIHFLNLLYGTESIFKQFLKLFHIISLYQPLIYEFFNILAKIQGN